MAFVPPIFTKFGKTCSDLLTQKWEAAKGDLKHQASIKSAAQGVTITSTVYNESKEGDKLSGKVNVKYEDRSFGETTFEYATAGTVKATAKLSKLQKGLVVNGEGECCGQDNVCKASGKASIEYSKEAFALQLEYNNKKNNVKTAAAVGFEGLSAGVAATVDLKKAMEKDANNNKSSPVVFEAGVQYEDGNLVGTVCLEPENKIGLSLYHRVASNLQLGSKFLLCNTGQNNSLTVGGLYNVDSRTTVKGKAEIFSGQNYILSTWLEHRLENPNVVVGFTNQWNSADKAKSAFAVNLGLGEI